MRSAETSRDPESGEPLEKILIELPQDHWSGSGAERVWAVPLGNDEYEIQNTPWYAMDVNWGDVVVCQGMSPADLPTVARVLRPSGHRTLRLMFDDALSDSQRDEILHELNELGSTYENADGSLYSLDVEPDVELTPILDRLAREEEQGKLNWETGWS